MAAAHCVHLYAGQIRSMQHANVGIAHNPSSNLKLASGFAPIKRMLDLNCIVGIGTDGAASNNDLDMMEEIRLASFIAKAASGDPTALPARQAIEMATSLGAKALHIDHITGSLVPGKRADLILIDVERVHNQPRFRREPNEIYAKIVYAAKSTDITDVMVNGKWLMQGQELTTIDEAGVSAEAQSYANRIDTFLIGREESVLSKLVAIGGAAEEESFEVQAKVSVGDLGSIIQALDQPEIEISRVRHYHEYDNYFYFRDSAQGMLRYREDEFLDPNGKVSNVRSRLTLIGQGNDRTRSGQSQVMLSRSRYLAPAIHSLRFYNEYFKPTKITEIEKNRLRYLIRYKNTELFVNLDEILQPGLGKFVEVKSRTWSRQDADNKILIVHDLLKYLGLETSQLITKDYINLVEDFSG